MLNTLEGKGKIDYNLKEDILYFYIDKFKSPGAHVYEASVDLDGFIIDIDQDNHVIGIELLDASNKLNIDKTVLQFIKEGKFKAMVEEHLIIISFALTAVIRNKLQHFTLNAERLNTSKLKASGLECQIMPRK